MVRTFLSICLISALLALADSAGFLVPLHNAISGHRFKLADRQPSGDIIFVDVDAKSIDSVGQWPWPRSLYAALFDQLTSTCGCRTTPASCRPCSPVGVASSTGGRAPPGR